MKLAKLSLMGGVALTGVIPVAALISCGNSLGRYDTNNDGVVKILTSFSASGKQYEALEKMVDEYNKNKQTNGFTVELVGVQGGYKDIPSNLAQNFQVQEKNKLPNLAIGYPDHLGTDNQ